MDQGRDWLSGRSEICHNPKMRGQAEKNSAKLSDYLDMIAAARSTVNHFSLGDVSR